MRDYVVDRIVEFLVIIGGFLFILGILSSLHRAMNNPEYGTSKDYDIEYFRLIYLSTCYTTKPYVEVAYNDVVERFSTGEIKIDDSCFVREKIDIGVNKELHLTLDAYKQVLNQGGD